MNTFVVRIESVDENGTFNGMVQYDDGTTSIATRYTDKEKFIEAVRTVFEIPEDMTDVMSTKTE